MENGKNLTINSVGCEREEDGWEGKDERGNRPLRPPINSHHACMLLWYIHVLFSLELAW